MRFRVLCVIATVFQSMGFVPSRANTPLVDLVDPFLGTAPLTDAEDIGFKPPWRVWAGLTFPGASLPNAMVQLSPITKFRSGAGYQYEDDTIYAFTHTNKGHWNLCYIPILPCTGDVDPRDYGSRFRHENESASPGYYQVMLDRYGIDVELTTTLRCGYHRYSYPAGETKKLLLNLGVSNERVREWSFEQVGDQAFEGFQDAREKVYFYATTNHRISSVDRERRSRRRDLTIVTFKDGEEPLEVRIGLSFVSTDNARTNLELEVAAESFDEVRAAAASTWEHVLSRMKVTGGTQCERGLFYSCLYRSMLWPALRSDVNGEFTDQGGNVVKKDFDYYTKPSLWDDYRNKLVLLAILEPQVTCDVIQSMIDRGNLTGFMPTFFHGDHAAPFIAGSYLRGLRDYDVPRAYELLVANATVESHARPHLDEYMLRGYVSTPAIDYPTVETKAKAGVTKTLEYAYDDYAVALLAKELDDDDTYQEMMERAGNYANVFDPSSGLMRGRLANGHWVEPFDAKYPYYEYMYREANAWQSSFFAPHDTDGLVALFPSPTAFEQQLDRLFSIPWDPRHVARNITSFIGQYCHGNQPDHGFPYLYYWVGKQEKSQAILNEIMARFYGMDDGRTLCGMDDAGEMSSWYVFNAIGLYPYSPADPQYIVCVPLFDKVELSVGDNVLEIHKRGEGSQIRRITNDGKTVSGYFVPHTLLVDGDSLAIEVSPAGN